MPETRLSRDDWVNLAIDVLLQDGPDGIAVQPLARRLDTTKGSFYWHFSSREVLLGAALQRWEAAATDAAIEAIESQSADPHEKAALLITEITNRCHENPGELLMLAGASHPDVGSAVERVSWRRIDYLARLLRAEGLTPAVAHRRATIGYAACIGHAQLAHAVPAVLPTSPRGRRALAAEMSEILLKSIDAHA